jgi:hypothetical protein
MIYFKGVFIGFGVVLLGCLVAPIALMIWTIWKSQRLVYIFGVSASI